VHAVRKTRFVRIYTLEVRRRNLGSHRGIMMNHEIGTALREVNGSGVEVRALMERLQYHAPSQGHGDLV
jgi:hypothetical protein